MAKAIVSGIYRILNMENGKFYIGSAVDVASRWSGHRNRLRRGRHHSQHLQNAWNKYGEESFDFSVIEVVSCRDELIAAEQRHIDLLLPAYNVCKVAGSPIGVKQSDESKAKKSLALKGRVFSEESKEKMRAARSSAHQIYLESTKVFELDKSLKRRISKARSSARGTNKRVISSEHRKKISAAKMGKNFSDSHKQSLSAAAKKRGAPILSDESRRRGDSKRRGAKRTEEQISRMKQAAVGRKWPEDVIRKRAESLKRTLAAKKAAKQQATT